jgi:hypothetical protein
MKKYTVCGINIYDELPEKSILATIDDFHINDVRKIGMKFYVRNSKNEYEEYTVKENTESKKLIGFIKVGRVFIKEGV